MSEYPIAHHSLIVALVVLAGPKELVGCPPAWLYQQITLPHSGLGFRLLLFRGAPKCAICLIGQAGPALLGRRGHGGLVRVAGCSQDSSGHAKLGC